MTVLNLKQPLAAVFFDLDGTLADTATDLSIPINAMRQAQGLPALELSALRPHASHGARGLIGKGFGISPDHPQYEALRQDFLARYEAAMVVHTRLFDGMADVLQALEARGIAWGVVSNKVERYVRPIMAALGVLDRAVSAVGGDTTPHAKPHPEPLLHAARLARVDPRACVYIGDDLRDVHAGQAAGMATIAAAYGFCGETPPVSQWGADALIDHPLELLNQLGLSQRAA
ncbi:MAG: HAD-IA family hydrolase [Burkholderiaceae bacterium]